MSDDLSHPYALPDDNESHPARFAESILKLPEHAHLVDGEAGIDYLLRTHERIKGGRYVLGTAHMPSVQGELKECFEWLLFMLFGRLPDFLIVLDRAYWEQATPLQREILIYHELTHCIQKVDMYGAPRFHRDGRPMWGLRGHDVEEFTAVVRRYGAYSQDIAGFIAAAIEGNRAHGR